LRPEWIYANFTSMKFTRSAILILCAMLLSCSQPRITSTAEAPGVDKSPVEETRDIETIAIAGTNDIHGALAPMEMKTREATGVPGTPYLAGGVAYLASYIKILRDELGPKLLWLDAGDEFQGTIESNPNHGAAMVGFFNAAGLNAAAIGNHEFDFGAEAPDTTDRLSSLKHRMLEAKYPYLAANIADKATGELEQFPNTFPSKIFPVGRVKVGVIGLSTVDTPRTTLPTNVEPLSFTSLHDATVREAAELRKQGADVVVVTAHAGTFCDLSHAPQGHALRKPTDIQGACKDEEIARLIKSLPPGTIDGVISGHTHSLIHHWIAGVPVVQAGSSGRYFNVLYLTYDLLHHQLLADRSRIEGPIPICPAVFQNQADCNGDRPAPPAAKGGRGPLITPEFHRIAVHVDSHIEKLLAPTFAEADLTKNKVYGQAATSLEHNRYAEAPLGNLLADSIRAAAKSDFAFMNAGGIRADIEQGPITYGEIFRVSPFDNTIVILKLTGKQVRTLIRIAESGARGFPPVSGMQLKLIHPDSDAPSDDLNGDGHIDTWEINRLLEIRLPNGELLNDRKEYTLATLDYLVLGGDDMGWIMPQLNHGDKKPDFTGVIVREALASYISELTKRDGAVNGPTSPLVNSAAPRIVFQKVAKKAGKHSRRKRRHKAAA
jgi:5'-nucleotidase